jgi:SAM-dependent methyltransferase
MDCPSTSRIDNVLFGRAYNFAVDRRAVAAVADAGWLGAMMWAQREFLGRAVRRLVAGGVDQFVDVGCGIPVLGATHEVAQGVDPTVRVVYVDNDEVTAALARDLVRDRARVAVVRADVRDMSSVLDRPRVTGLLDLTAPVGVVAVGVLHFVDNAAQVMAELASWLAPGSHVVVSHATAGDDPHHRVCALAGLYEATPTPLVPRSRGELVRLLAGFDLVGEGLVPPHRWQPESASGGDPQPCDGIPLLAGVGRRR